MSLDFIAFAEAFPLASEFRISRGTKTQADVITVIVTDGHYYGWGESVPYARYHESIEQVLLQLREVKPNIRGIKDNHELLSLLPAGSARNALDAALWDLRAKQTGSSVSALADLPEVNRCYTAQTLSIDSPNKMAEQALCLQQAPLIKVKLDGELVIERLTAISLASPKSRLIVDANEGWSLDQLHEWLPALQSLNVALIEQPVPSSDDARLADINTDILLCADESCHTSDNIDILARYYQAVNIKLDKTGGLTEGIRTLKQAKDNHLQVMVGCMVGSSLAMAPAFCLCDAVQFVDLDGPLLVANDREDGFHFECGKMTRPSPFLWGLPGQYGQQWLAARWQQATLQAG